MKLYRTCIQTHNIDKMINFYSSIFDYEPTVDGEVDFRFLKHQLIIFKLNDGEAPATKNVAMIYNVDDVDSEYSRLFDLSIAVNLPTDKPWGVRSFAINDPDGNLISFFTNLY